MRASNNIPPLPAGLSLADLTAAVNDRLRRVQPQGSQAATTIQRGGGGGGGSAGGAAVLSLEQTLTAAFTVTGAAPAWSAGSTLVVKLIENATGGWPVTWGAAFKHGPAIPTLANTESICTFFGAASGLWELAAVPILGRHI